MSPQEQFWLWPVTRTSFRIRRRQPGAPHRPSAGRAGAVVATPTPRRREPLAQWFGVASLGVIGCCLDGSRQDSAPIWRPFHAKGTGLGMADEWSIPAERRAVNLTWGLCPLMVRALFLVTASRPSSVRRRKARVQKLKAQMGCEGAVLALVSTGLTPNSLLRTIRAAPS